MKFKNIFTHKKILFAFAPVLFGGLTLGVFIQLNWIHHACSNEPFLGAQRVACQDNLLRLLLGGSSFALLFYTLSFFQLKTLFKKYKFSFEKDITEHRVFKVTVRSYYSLMTIVFLPLFEYNEIYLFLGLAFFLVINILESTNPKNSPEYGEAFFELIEDDSVVVKFIGKCNEKNIKTMYQTIIECLTVIPDVKNLKIDLDNVVDIDARGRNLINLLLEGAGFYSLAISYSDSHHYLKE